MDILINCYFKEVVSLYELAYYFNLSKTQINYIQQLLYDYKSNEYQDEETKETVKNILINKTINYINNNE